jgi:DNA repair exonuclease SbcCD ATPase subunit
MEIQRVALETIGCFEEQQFDFSNLTVIFGENRTGKSTLVYSLFFALFGIHLHKALKPEDLCQKGRQFGIATLYFNKAGEACKLRRSTIGTPGIYTKSEDGAWDPVYADVPAGLNRYIPISAEVASLSSFFREGELIYFLQDIPKYNKTLLQSLIGIDEALIVQSRFRKVSNIAKDGFVNIKRQKEAIQKEFPRGAINYHTPEQLKKGVSELELKYQAVQKEKEKIALEPERFKSLQQRNEEKKTALETALKSKEKIPPAQELETKKAGLEKRLSEKDGLYQRQSELYRQIGSFEQREKDLQANLENLERLEKQAICPTCEQSLSENHMKELASKLKQALARVSESKLSAHEELKQIEGKIREIQEKEKALRETDRQIREGRRLDEQIRQLKEDLSKTEEEFKRFRQAYPNIKALENLSRRKEELETEEAVLYKQIAKKNAQVTRVEYNLERIEKINKELHIAERNAAVCRAAFRAVGNAIQDLSSGLLVRVRESMREWLNEFSFLDQFDIEIKDTELLPIIQARGYQYKLNQMSKSERIFLYLMLKLAIGDAMGHLGLFVLDDPADGLDLKRKQTLAYLLTEISQRRQIIVTTNDADFAELFAKSSRINL